MAKRKLPAAVADAVYQGEGAVVAEAWLEGGGKVDARCDVLTEARRRRGSTLLMLACSGGDEQLLTSLLVRHGPAIDLRNSAGETALMIATCGNRPTFVRRLLRAGASLDLKNRRGKTALQVAKDEGHAECVRVIEDFLERDCRSQADMLLEGASPSPSPEWSTSGGAFLDVLPPAVVAACQGEEDEAVSEWLANGGQIDATHSYSDGSMHTSDLTLLMTAANTGNKAMVDMLLGHGADVDKKNRFGNTALSQAAAKGHERVVDALLRAGADINVQNTKAGRRCS